AFARQCGGAGGVEPVRGSRSALEASSRGAVRIGTPGFARAGLSGGGETPQDHSAGPRRRVRGNRISGAEARFVTVRVTLPALRADWLYRGIGRAEAPGVHAAN